MEEQWGEECWCHEWVFLEGDHSAACLLWSPSMTAQQPCGPTKWPKLGKSGAHLPVILLPCWSCFGQIISAYLKAIYSLPVSVKQMRAVFPSSANKQLYGTGGFRPKWTCEGHWEAGYHQGKTWIHSCEIPTAGSWGTSLVLQYFPLVWLGSVFLPTMNMHIPSLELAPVSVIQLK